MADLVKNSNPGILKLKATHQKIKSTVQNYFKKSENNSTKIKSFNQTLKEKAVTSPALAKTNDKKMKRKTHIKIDSRVGKSNIQNNSISGIYFSKGKSDNINSVISNDVNVNENTSNYIKDNQFSQCNLSLLSQEIGKNSKHRKKFSQQIVDKFGETYINLFSLTNSKEVAVTINNKPQSNSSNKIRSDKQSSGQLLSQNLNKNITPLSVSANSSNTKLVVDKNINGKIKKEISADKREINITPSNFLAIHKKKRLLLSSHFDKFRSQSQYNSNLASNLASRILTLNSEPSNRNEKKENKDSDSLSHKSPNTPKEKNSFTEKEKQASLWNENNEKLYTATTEILLTYIKFLHAQIADKASYFQRLIKDLEKKNKKLLLDNNFLRERNHQLKSNFLKVFSGIIGYEEQTRRTNNEIVLLVNQAIQENCYLRKLSEQDPLCCRNPQAFRNALDLTLVKCTSELKKHDTNLCYKTLPANAKLSYFEESDIIPSKDGELNSSLIRNDSFEIEINEVKEPGVTLFRQFPFWRMHKGKISFHRKAEEFY